jgi:hypothetical protein
MSIFPILAIILGAAAVVFSAADDEPSSPKSEQPANSEAIETDGGRPTMESTKALSGVVDKQSQAFMVCIHTYIII